MSAEPTLQLASLPFGESIGSPLTVYYILYTIKVSNVSGMNKVKGGVITLATERLITCIIHCILIHIHFISARRTVDSPIYKIGCKIVVHPRTQFAEAHKKQLLICTSTVFNTSIRYIYRTLLLALRTVRTILQYNPV